MALHEPSWQADDSILTKQQRERGYSGYRCTQCGRTIAVPPNGMPSLGTHS